MTLTCGSNDQTASAAEGSGPRIVVGHKTVVACWRHEDQPRLSGIGQYQRLIGAVFGLFAQTHPFSGGAYQGELGIFQI